MADIPAGVLVSRYFATEVARPDQRPARRQGMARASSAERAPYRETYVMRPFGELFAVASAY